MDIDQFTAVCEHLAEQIPPALLIRLSGGIIISEADPQLAEGPPGTVKLGEYVSDYRLGRYIVIYYQAFKRMFRSDEQRLINQLRTTLLHEIRHHIESLAGVDDLIRDDIRKLAAMWSRVQDQ